MSILIYFSLLIFLITHIKGTKIGFLVSLFFSVVSFLAIANNNYLAVSFSFVLLSLPAILHIFKHYLHRNLNKAKKRLDSVRGKLNQLNDEIVALEDGKRKIEKIFERIESQYKIAKELSSTMNINSIVEIFRREVIGLDICDDCKFSYNKSGLKDFKDTHPLKYEGKELGFFGVKNLKDQASFNIVFSQFVLVFRRAKSYAEVEKLSITDDLTHLYLRRHMLERFDEEFLRSVKRQLNISFIMIDIDNFKSYNDKYGHLVGDAILSGVSEIITGNIREIDLVGRYGGEEFSVVLPETDKKGCFMVAERIREEVASKVFKPYDEELKLTISLGVASYPDDSAKMQGLIDLADKALYEAKTSGKNKTIAYGS